jgi:hypothetical protein
MNILALEKKDQMILIKRKMKKKDQMILVIKKQGRKRRRWKTSNELMQ